MRDPQYPRMYLAPAGSEGIGCDRCVPDQTNRNERQKMARRKVTTNIDCGGNCAEPGERSYCAITSAMTAARQHNPILRGQKVRNRLRKHIWNGGH